MAGMVKVTGVTVVRKNMAMFTKDLSVQFAIGLRKAGLLLQYISQKHYCPVHQGHLKASAFTRSTGSGFSMGVIVGYTAKYAAYVHEDLDKRHGRVFNEYYAKQIAEAHTSAQKRYYFNRGATQQAKFLEKPARENQKELLAVIMGQAMQVQGHRLIQGKVF
jgi:hypothetical protein